LVPGTAAGICGGFFCSTPPPSSSESISSANAALLPRTSTRATSVSHDSAKHTISALIEQCRGVIGNADLHAAGVL